MKNTLLLIAFMLIVFNLAGNIWLGTAAFILAGILLVNISTPATN